MAQTKKGLVGTGFFVTAVQLQHAPDSKPGFVQKLYAGLASRVTCVFC